MFNYSNPDRACAKAITLFLICNNIFFKISLRKLVKIWDLPYTDGKEVEYLQKYIIISSNNNVLTSTVYLKTDNLDVKDCD